MVAERVDLAIDMGQELDRNEVRSRREALGLTQAAAAAAAGFKWPAQWADVETGRKNNLTIVTLDKIATALDCDVRDLITPRKPKRKGAK